MAIQSVENSLYMFVNLQNTLDMVSVKYESSEPSDIIKESLLESKSDKIKYKSSLLSAESSSSENNLSSPDILKSRLDHELFLPTNTVESTEEDNILAHKLIYLSHKWQAGNI
ncbi:uncharacterized protein CIMG_13340 [Coccidioides immitis RS]|uniref:Uncharacterized protein n=1 Tax=Coccidioides immitis (strain RS) TaxID=246410 RepID=A0A0D8JVH7_COCIM|nr:uncharacterized protein CIMG_13340 [Coccidioides immitis RS]KJF60946.1 hypothetical protein CIMG_13340 [Coccidioides immitis RS]